MVEVVAVAVVDTEEVVEDLVVRLMSLRGDGIRIKTNKQNSLHLLDDEPPLSFST